MDQIPSPHVPKLYASGASQLSPVNLDAAMVRSSTSVQDAHWKLLGPIEARILDGSTTDASDLQKRQVLIKADHVRVAVAAATALGAMARDQNGLYADAVDEDDIDLLVRSSMMQGNIIAQHHVMAIIERVVKIWTTSVVPA